jgi:hypothetical protein
MQVFGVCLLRTKKNAQREAAGRLSFASRFGEAKDFGEASSENPVQSMTR